MSNERFKVVTAVHLLLVKDEQILLLRRFKTGYEDGKYSVPAGHIDGKESASKAMVREAKEETGIIINKLKMVHVMHRKADEERIDFFFEVNEWLGVPQIVEPDKCDDLRWYAIGQLPRNMVPYVRAGIKNYQDRIPYSEFGWNT